TTIASLIEKVWERRHLYGKVNLASIDNTMRESSGFGDGGFDGFGDGGFSFGDGGYDGFGDGGFSFGDGV
ncbi:unnamed protein product, partial [Rotaria sp. Silwood2]